MTTYEQMEASPHTAEDFAAAQAFFATHHDTWFQIEGKFSINRETVTGERYDPAQGGWAWCD